MRVGEIVYVVFALVALGGYAHLETRGFGLGGSKKPPIPTEQLRSNAPGSWNYVYWAHGSLGK